MPTIPASLLSTALGLAAALAAIALFVEVIQEVYKHLTKSKSRCYEKVLTDSLGPWVAQAADRPTFLDLTVRGPFQWLRRRPTGVLLPLDRDDLTGALERTAPEWQQRALQAIRDEVRRQGGKPGRPSQSWLEFVHELSEHAAGDVGRHRADRDRAEREDPSPTVPVDWSAGEILRFLERRGYTPVASETTEGLSSPGTVERESIDARALEVEFRQHFMPHVLQAGERHGRILQNFEYAYQRRNLRQTFLFGIVLAVGANLPLDRLYHEAAALSPTESAQLAEQVISRYEALDCVPGDARTGCVTLRQAEDLLTTALCGLREDLDQTEETCPSRAPFRVQLANVTGSLGGALAYLLWCALTAFLISFGAPFWHDVVSMLGRVGARRSAEHTGSEEGD